MQFEIYIKQRREKRYLIKQIYAKVLTFVQQLTWRSSTLSPYISMCSETVIEDAGIPNGSADDPQERIVTDQFLKNLELTTTKVTLDCFP